MMWTRGLSGAAVLSLWLATQTVWAQQRLPGAIISSPGELSGTQKAEVERFVEDWVKVLREAKPGDEERVSQARYALILPFQQGASESFKKAYCPTLCAQLKPLLGAGGAPWSVTRLNVMIVVANVPDKAAIPLIELGLTDSHDAVRYWAAKAIEYLVRRGGVPSGDEIKLLRALSTAAAKESSEKALAQYMVALASLKGQEAIAELVQILTERVAIHVAKPDLSIGPEVDALRAVYQQVITDTLRKLAPDPVLRQIMAVTFRYLKLAANGLNTKGPRAGNPANRPDYVAMIELADSVLPWAARQLAPAEGGLPQAMLPLVSSLPPRIAEANLKVEDWRTFFTTKCGIAAADLVVAAPAPPPPTTNPAPATAPAPTP